MSAAQDGQAPAIPKQIPKDCSHCGQPVMVPNPVWYRLLRYRSNFKLRQMAELADVSVSYLARMESGESPFAAEVAAVYERTLERCERAGEYLDDERIIP